MMSQVRDVVALRGRRAAGWAETARGGEERRSSEVTAATAQERPHPVGDGA